MATSVEKTYSARIGEGEGSRLSKWTMWVLPATAHYGSWRYMELHMYLFAKL